MYFWHYIYIHTYIHIHICISFFSLLSREHTTGQGRETSITWHPSPGDFYLSHNKRQLSLAVDFPHFITCKIQWNMALTLLHQWREKHHKNQSWEGCTVPIRQPQEALHLLVTKTTCRGLEALMPNMETCWHAKARGKLVRDALHLVFSPVSSTH